MSIESLLDRIAKAQERTADALEKLISSSTFNQSNDGSEIREEPKSHSPQTAPNVTDAGSAVAPAPSASVQNQPTAPTPVQPSAPAAPVPSETPNPQPVAPAPVTPPQTAPVTLTMEELNTELVKEFQRLGGKREPIDKVMVEKYGVQSIREIPAEKYSELLEAVRGIPNA